MIEFDIEGNILSSICDAVAVITKEPAFVFQESGVSIVALDDAKIMLANIGLRKSLFNTYDVPGLQKVSFDIKELAKHLSGAAGPTMITIKSMEYGDKENRLDLMVPSRYGFKSIFIPILGEVEPSMVPKAMPFDSFCKIDVGGLEQIARDADRVDTVYCRFSIGDEDQLVAKLVGDNSTVTNVLEDGKSIICKKFNPEAKFVLSKEYLADAVKICKFFTNITKMSFGSALMPIMFEHQLPFDALFRIYIAPITNIEGATP